MPRCCYGWIINLIQSGAGFVGMDDRKRGLVVSPNNGGVPNHSNINIDTTKSVQKHIQTPATTLKGNNHDKNHLIIIDI
nr:hypothetical protein CFP56_48919 [Quercus suber]